MIAVARRAIAADVRLTTTGAKASAGMKSAFAIMSADACCRWMKCAKRPLATKENDA